MKKEEGKRVVISTIYEGFAINYIIPKLSPDKLILLIDEPKFTEKKEKMNEVIRTIKSFFKDSIVVETEKISSYDIPKIMSEVIKIIDKESKEGNEIVVHITEGRKTTSLAVLFAAYIRKENVKGAYYLTEEEHNIINLPLLNFDINGNKKIILREIDKGNSNLNILMDKLKIKKSAMYRNIDELKNEGCLEDNKELKLTDLGRIMIL